MRLIWGLALGLRWRVSSPRHRKSERAIASHRKAVYAEGISGDGSLARVLPAFPLA